jgi:hypothetical protein
LKIIFGMIARQLTDPGPIIAFLSNAASHQHKIERVIVSVSGEIDPVAIRTIEAHAPLEVIDLNRPEARMAELVELGLTEDEATALFCHPVYDLCGRMPYGPNRNRVILAAIKAGGDVLFFADSDVSPALLSGTPHCHYFDEADVFGSHLAALKDSCLPMVGVTTSDYSGYYIIPPMSFEGLDIFLEGLQKEGALDFVRHSGQHHALTFDAGAARQPFSTDKILGGNVAMRLEIFRECLPFFSTAYNFEGTWWLTRGEDTLLGKSLAAGDKWKIVDIDLRLFHDTFDNFPEVPDLLSDEGIRDRFYTTCLGWIGRNPILNALDGKDAAAISNRQIECLARSVDAAAAYFGDDRFLKLPEAAKAALEQLPAALEAYKSLQQLWPKAVEGAWRLRYGERAEAGGAKL